MDIWYVSFTFTIVSVYTMHAHSRITHTFFFRLGLPSSWQPASAGGLELRDLALLLAAASCVPRQQNKNVLVKNSPCWLWAELPFSTLTQLTIPSHHDSLDAQGLFLPCTVITRRLFTLGSHKTNLSSRPRQFSWLTFCFAIVTCARKQRERELCCALSSLVASHQIQNEKKRGDGTTNADNILKEKIPLGLKTWLCSAK